MILKFNVAEERIPLCMAIKAVKERGLSISCAARAYNINLTTLRDHIKGKCKDAPKPYKRKRTLITDDEEEQLVKRIKEAKLSGFRVCREDIAKEVQVGWLLAITMGVLILYFPCPPLLFSCHDLKSGRGSF